MSYPVPALSTTKSLARHRFFKLGALVTGLLVLSGCMRTNVNLELFENDTASMVMGMAIQDSALEPFGISPEAFWAEVSGDLNTEDLQRDIPGATVDPFPEEGWTGMQINIPAVPFDELTATDDVGVSGLTVERVGDSFEISAALGQADQIAEIEATAADSGGLIDAEQMLSTMDLSFTLTCPGPIQVTNGQASGNQVTWNLLDFDSSERLTATCAASAPVADIPGNDSAAAEYGQLAAGGENRGFFSQYWPFLVGFLAVLGAAGFGLYWKTAKKGPVA